MTDKDPNDMTASELLLWAANGEENEYGHKMARAKLFDALIGENFYFTKNSEERQAMHVLADKIDAELTEARDLSLRQGAELWAKANGWPDFREGEDFGAWLERCALKLPCDKDGEPWSIGDRVMPGNRSESTVTGYDFDGNEWFLKYRWCGIDSYANEFATSCKRPAPEALGADGLPIVEGETVYDVETGEAYIVRLPCAGTGKTFFEGGGYRDPAYLTHTPPDTQERIDADALKSCVKYWDCDDFSCGKCPALIDGKKPVEFYELDPIHDSCHEAQKLDLLRRQRELDARKGGTE